MNIKSSNNSESQIIYYSNDRPYNLPEEQYDQHYNRTITNEAVLGAIKQFQSLCKIIGISYFKKVLEIGCGTGRFTLGMVGSGLVKEALVTDASSTFVNLTASKIIKYLHDTNTKVLYGVLDGNDSDKLEKGFDCVILWAALHHFDDWRAILDKILKILSEGGILMMSEPCIEFSMTIAPLLIASKTNTKVDKDNNDLELINKFSNALKFRTQADYPNRNKMEDKHIFRTDDLYRYAGRNNLHLSILPNSKPETRHPYGSSAHEKGIQEYRDMVFRRLRFMSSFSDVFCKSFIKEYSDALDLLGYVSANGAGPYFDCVYMCKKTGSQKTKGFLTQTGAQE